MTKLIDNTYYTKLIDNLHFTDGDLFRNGQKIFTVPTKVSRDIGVLASHKTYHNNPTFIYIGTSSCCHGHIYCMTEDGDLLQIISVGTNIMDLLPVQIDASRIKHPYNRSMLIAGVGCAGSGVFLISTYYPREVQIISEKMYWENAPNQIKALPIFVVDHSNGKIFLGFREATSKVPAPSLGKFDLTPYLRNYGYQREETMRFLESFDRKLKTNNQG